jgi:8-oxo-dGTP diphosphatase
MADSRRREQPWVTVDVVVVAQLEGQLKVLLIKRNKPPFAGLWAIPGGFVEPDEPLRAAAGRELWEETGARPTHLEQLHTFGDPGRDPRGWNISVVYLARLGEDEAQANALRAGSDAREIGWFSLDGVPPLAFDHADILACALRRLRQRADR